MEQLYRKIAMKITSEASLSGEKQQVAVYGLLALMQMVTILTVTLIFGVVFGFWAETLIIFFGVGLLRRSTGGFHASSMLSCTLMSIVSVTAMSLLCRYILIRIDNIFIYLALQAMTYTFCGIIIYKKAPMDTPNKPIKKQEKIKRLRMQCLVSVICFFAISCIFYFLRFVNKGFISISFAFNLSLLWQTMTLTKAGEVFIRSIEKLINVKSES